jgi:hypothetical protein
MRVAVVGASDKPHRYAYKALKLLCQKGHEVAPVHPRIKFIDGIAVYPKVTDIPDPVHTITLYINADISNRMADAIIELDPKRIIFNPGAENPELTQKAAAHDIDCLDACTLVLLRTDQF